MRDLSRDLYEVAGDVPSLERSFRRGADEHSLIASWEVAALGLVERLNEVEEPRCLRAVRKRVSLAEVAEAGLVTTVRAGRSALLGALKRAHHEDRQGTTLSPVLARVDPPACCSYLSRPRFYTPLPPLQNSSNGTEPSSATPPTATDDGPGDDLCAGFWVDGLRVVFADI